MSHLGVYESPWCHRQIRRDMEFQTAPLCEAGLRVSLCPAHTSHIRPQDELAALQFAISQTTTTAGRVLPRRAKKQYQHVADGKDHSATKPVDQKNQQPEEARWIEEIHVSDMRIDQKQRLVSTERQNDAGRPMIDWLRPAEVLNRSQSTLYSQVDLPFDSDGNSTRILIAPSLRSRNMSKARWICASGKRCVSNGAKSTLPSPSHCMASGNVRSNDG
jgi:hypothetical protein